MPAAARAPKSPRLTVAVTGPTGEIGRAVVGALERSNEVGRVLGMARRPFDPAAHGWKKVTYRQGDVLDPATVAGLVADADVVVHLAFLIMGGQRETRAVNLEGSRNVFQAAVSAKVKRLDLCLVGRRIRIPRRQPPAADRGDARARHRGPLLLGPEGRGRGDAGGGSER